MQPGRVDESWTIGYARALLVWFGAAVALIGALIVVALQYGSRAAVFEYGLLAGVAVTLGVALYLFDRMLAEARRRREDALPGMGR